MLRANRASLEKMSPLIRPRLMSASTLGSLISLWVSHLLIGKAAPGSVAAAVLENTKFFFVSFFAVGAAVSCCQIWFQNQPNPDALTTKFAELEALRDSISKSIIDVIEPERTKLLLFLGAMFVVLAVPVSVARRMVLDRMAWLGRDDEVLSAISGSLFRGSRFFCHRRDDSGCVAEWFALTKRFFRKR